MKAHGPTNRLSLSQRSEDIYIVLLHNMSFMVGTKKKYNYVIY